MAYQHWKDDRNEHGLGTWEDGLQAIEEFDWEAAIDNIDWHEGGAGEPHTELMEFETVEGTVNATDPGTSDAHLTVVSEAKYLGSLAPPNSSLSRASTAQSDHEPAAPSDGVQENHSHLASVSEAEHLSSPAPSDSSLSCASIAQSDNEPAHPSDGMGEPKSGFLEQLEAAAFSEPRGSAALPSIGPIRTSVAGQGLRGLKIGVEDTGLTSQQVQEEDQKQDQRETRTKRRSQLMKTVSNINPELDTSKWSLQRLEKHVITAAKPDIVLEYGARYQAMTTEALKQELHTRNIEFDKKAKKAILVQKLLDSDQNAEPGGEEDTAAEDDVTPMKATSEAGTASKDEGVFGWFRSPATPQLSLDGQISPGTSIAAGLRELAPRAPSSSPDLEEEHLLLVDADAEEASVASEPTQKDNKTEPIRVVRRRSSRFSTYAADVVATHDAAKNAKKTQDEQAERQHSVRPSSTPFAAPEEPEKIVLDGKVAAVDPEVLPRRSSRHALVSFADGMVPTKAQDKPAKALQNGDNDLNVEKKDPKRAASYPEPEGGRRRSARFARAP